MEALKAAAFEELVSAREDRNKANAISRKFHDFVEHPSDVVNKARLYDESVGQLGASPAPKVIRCLVDYNAKMEKLLKEIQTLLQPGSQQPTTQQPTPEPAEQPTLAPVTTPLAQSEEHAIPTRTTDPIV